MGRSSEKFADILEYREKKSRELRRMVSFSEAIALWLSENLKISARHSPENA